MNNDFPNFKKDIDQIEVPEEKLNTAVNSAIKRGKKKKWSFGKKVTYLSGAAVIVFCLLIGSSFVSPAMAKVMSNVPLVSEILQSMEQTKNRKERIGNFYSKVYETLSNNKHYKGVVNVSMSMLFSSEPPEINVWIEDKSSKQELVDEIEQVINDLANSYNIGEVEIKVEKKDKEIVDRIEKEKERSGPTMQLFKISQEVLQPKGYRIRGIGIDGENPSIKIEIDGVDKQFKKEKNAIEKRVQEAIYSKKHLKYNVKITGPTEAEIRDQDWRPIFRSVREEAHKKFNKVTGFAYSFYPKPLEIILKTSLSEEDQDKKVAENIARYARQVIEIKRNKLSVEKIPYKIIIRDKEARDLYEVLYSN